MRKIFANLGWLLGARGINAAFSLIYLTLATRSLGLTGFGNFVIIVAMAQTLAGIVGFSTWQAVVRWGQEASERRSAIGFAVALDGLSIGIGAPLVAAAAWFAPLWLPLPADLRGAAVGLCVAAVVSLRSTPIGILRLHDRYAWGAAAEAALPATRAIGAVVAWLFAPGVTSFVIAWAIAEVACAAAHWVMAARLEPIFQSEVSLRQVPRQNPGAWRFVLATNASRTLAVSAKQGIVLLVGATGGAALAGGFRIAAQLGQALVQLAEAVSRAIYPELVRKTGAAIALVRRMAALGGSVGLIAAALAAAAGEWVVQTLAGPGFAFVVPAMILLALAGAAELVATSWDALIVARGSPGTVLLARALPLGTAIAALPWAVARFGLAGAAACILGASTVTALALGYRILDARRKGFSPVEESR